MSAQAERIARRRATVRRLREEGKSVREIALELNVGKSTVQDDLNAPVPDQPLAPPPADNERAVTHGCYSEKKLAPLREQHVIALRKDYPRLDDRRLWLIADSLAHIDNAAAWLDDQGGVVLNDAGDVFPVALAQARWRSEAMRRLTEVDAEAREQGQKPADLEAYVAGLVHPPDDESSSP